MIDEVFFAVWGGVCYCIGVYVGHCLYGKRWWRKP